MRRVLGHTVTSTRWNGAGLQMPLGLSVGEFLATTGVVAVSFGAKEIPFLARSLGKLAGYAVGENYVPKVAPSFH